MSGVFRLTWCALTVSVVMLCGGCGVGDVPDAAPDLEAATVAIEIVGQDERGTFVSHGAGTLLHEAGYVLTCEHITRETAHQQVILADGRSFPYRVLARAGGTYDMAILRFDAPPGLTPVVISTRGLTDEGEPVFLVGNPGGRGLTVLEGVVDLPDCGGGTQLQVGGARVLPGYSGGPVFDVDGAQVGLIHVAIRTAERVSRHIRSSHVRDGFARVFQDAARHAYPLGLVVDCDAPDARVTDVVDDSPADVAGVEVGDVITGIGAFPVRDSVHVVLAQMDRVAEAPVELRLEREGRVVRLRLVPRRR